MFTLFHIFVRSCICLCSMPDAYYNAYAVQKGPHSSMRSRGQYMCGDELHGSSYCLFELINRKNTALSLNRLDPDARGERRAGRCEQVTPVKGRAR